MERKNSTLVFDTIAVSEQECFYVGMDAAVQISQKG